MKLLMLVFALLIGAHVVLAQQKGPPGAREPLAEKPLVPPLFVDKPLPELKGVVSWKTLAEVKPVKQKDKFVPEFARSVLALDKKEVKLQGFMLPLDMGDKQTRFILTAMPPTCAFCLPGGPEQLVEVQTKTAVRYGFEPIILSGRLAVLKDDPMRLYYRLTDAVLTVAR
ncbi:MAG: DUF3299 domain-containing protein [Betaproteobacteria bacterium]|nr:DUF3299 domain-containing protein [Betaproteobacteria bacterium]